MKYYLATLLAIGTLATSSAAFADNHNHGRPTECVNGFDAKPLG